MNFQICVLILLMLCLAISASCQKQKQTNQQLDEFKIYEVKTRNLRYISIDSALVYLSQALRTARRINYIYGQAIILDRFAKINEEHDNIDLSVKYRQEALYAAEKQATSC